MKKIFLFSILAIIRSAFIGSNKIFDYSHVKEEPLNILAGSLSSKRAIIPYEYTKLSICQSKKIKKAEDTIGEILTGESLYTTGYKAYTNVDRYCHVLCYNTFSENNVKIIQKLIKRKYFSNWILDKLPAGLITYNKETKSTSLNYNNGIPLGFVVDKQFYIYNHLQFHILLNRIDEDRYNVVGFNILPMSIKHNKDKPICAKNANDILKDLNTPNQPLVQGNILFTYDVIYEYSDIPLASRWDHYKTSKSNIHWTGILITEILVICGTLTIFVILKQNLQKDISSYNYRVSHFEDINEYDWKQISGDVFRPPTTNILLFSSMLGTGAQLIAMFTLTLLLGMFGFVNPEKRLNIINIGILLYCLSGIIGGYIAANFYRFWGGFNWITSAVCTSFLFPGSLIFGYIIVNIVLTIEKSNAAVHFYDILSLFVLWLLCTFPLILLGSFFGFKSNKIDIPVSINKIPSIILEKPWYLHYRYTTFITGIIGFATIFIELNYVMGALWNHQIYFLGTFLWTSFLLFIVVVGEMSVIVVYCNLCYGDYNWWWKSFIIGASPVIYFILYTFAYFFYLKITRLSAMVVYFAMMIMISSMAMFICGTVSVFFTMGFVNRIYSSIRVD